MNKRVSDYYFGIIGGKKGLIPSVLRFFLAFFSLKYSIVMRLRAMPYRLKVLKKTKLPCAVISVGNITVGGTGKTPAVIAIAGMLRDSGRKVAVLSRGYKGKREKSGVSVVSDYDSVLLAPEESGDEPRMLAEKLKGVPVIVSRNRINGGERAVKDFDTEIVILDDGFQYLQLERDLDIVVIDCLSPFSNMKVLPRGLMREPVSCLKRADIFLLTRTDQVPDERKRFIYDFLKASAGEKPVVESVHKPSFLYRITDNVKKELSFIEGRDVSIVSGIGNPQSFEVTVKSLGANIVRRHVFPDHYDYKKEELDKIYSEKGTVITTEKDAVHLGGKAGENIWVLKIDLKIIAAGELWEEKIKNCLL